MKNVILIIGTCFSLALHAMNIMDIAGPAFLGISGIIVCKVAWEGQKISKEQNDSERLLRKSFNKIKDIDTTVEINEAIGREHIHPLLRRMRDTPDNMLQTLDACDQELAQEEIKLEHQLIRITKNQRRLYLSMFFLATGSLLCLKTFLYDYEGK